jgi:hypothetical protein
MGLLAEGHLPRDHRVGAAIAHCLGPAGVCWKRASAGRVASVVSSPVDRRERQYLPVPLWTQRPPIRRRSHVIFHCGDRVRI